MEVRERELGMEIDFLGMVMHQDDFPAGWFIPGRIAMVCCEEDVAFLGFPCRWDGEQALREHQWDKLTARMQVE